MRPRPQKASRFSPWIRSPRWQARLAGPQYPRQRQEPFRAGREGLAGVRSRQDSRSGLAAHPRRRWQARGRVQMLLRRGWLWRDRSVHRCLPKPRADLMGRLSRLRGRIRRPGRAPRPLTTKAGHGPCRTLTSTASSTSPRYAASQATDRGRRCDARGPSCSRTTCGRWS
jgi:hypothetical protein